jgi:hypothetical protein
MKKFVLFSVLAAGAVGIGLVVRRAMLDMKESEDLWTQITDEVEAQIAEVEAAQQAEESAAL